MFATTALLATLLFNRRQVQSPVLKGFKLGTRKVKSLPDNGGYQVFQKDGQIKVYGSGVISSHGECTNVIDGGCEIRNFSLDEVLSTPVKVDSIHKLLFAIESFDQIYEAMREAEKQTAGA